MSNYARSEERWRHLKAFESKLDLRYKSVDFLRPGKQKRVVLLFHGYTQSPKQFQKLGEAFSQKGAQVLIPRMPFHGKKDLGASLQNLTVEGLEAFVEQSVETAKGFGEELVVGGLSGGGVLASLVLLKQIEVKHLLMVAPVFGVLNLAPPVQRGLSALLPFLPDQRIPWEDGAETAYGYGHFSSKALGVYLKLGEKVLKERVWNKNLGTLSLVTNGADEKINVTALLSALQRGRLSENASFQMLHFAKKEKLPHDLIGGALQKDVQDSVHQKILKLVED